MTTFHFDLALRQGSFTLEMALIARARAIALVGPSGSGKTSVLEVIAGLRVPTRGRVAIADRVFFDSSERIDIPSRARRVGYVPQETLLFPHLNVRANIEYGASRRRAAARSEGLNFLDLESLMAREVSSLSGGERQRVALARALRSDPDVLLLDEPLAAVDLARRARVLDMLVTIRDTYAIPLVYVTHSPDEARAIADYAIALDHGRVVASGPARDILAPSRQ